MKRNKIMFLLLAFVLTLSLVACRNTDRNLTDNRRLSNQTRLNDTGWDTGIDKMDGDSFDIGQDRITQNDNLINNGTDFVPDDNLNNNLNNGMTRPNDNLSLSNDDVNNKSTDLARKIADLPEVDEASVVINNNTAIVGVSLRGNTQNTMTNALRDKIKNIVKKADTNITTVSITTEPELFTRIRTMSKDIEIGNPIKGFAEEIKDIIRKITPDTTITR